MENLNEKTLKKVSKSTKKKINSKEEISNYQG